MDAVTITGVGASTCTAVSLLPQVFKVFKAKKAENVSVWMLVVLFCGLILWIIYGAMKDDLIIIISNSVSFVINTLLAVLMFKYKENK